MPSGVSSDYSGDLCRTTPEHEPPGHDPNTEIRLEMRGEQVVLQPLLRGAAAEDDAAASAVGGASQEAVMSRGIPNTFRTRTGQ